MSIVTSCYGISQDVIILSVRWNVCCTAGVALTALPLKPTTNSTKSFVVIRKGQAALSSWSLGPYGSWGDGSALDTHPTTGRVYAAVRYAAGNAGEGPVGTWVASWTNEQLDRLVEG